MGRKVESARPAGTGTGAAEGCAQDSVPVAKVEGHETPPLDWRAEVARLAKLSPIEYDRRREGAAAALGCRVGTLDQAVAAARGNGEGPAGQGKSLDLPDVEPWPAPVEAAELLDELTRAIRSFVVMSDEATTASALWVVFAHCLDLFEFSPRLLINSPLPECGKSTLVELLAELTPRPLPVNNITSAALFRTIELARPTILIDEADTFLRDSEELRGLVNSGHRRNLAFVVRNVEVQGQHEPRKFSTWCVMAIAGLGRQHATVEGRSIAIAMRRKLPGERTERLDGEARERLRCLARKIARWREDNSGALARAASSSPPLPGRAGDNWTPLLAVAAVAGGPWPELARAAAATLSGGAGKDGRCELLLRDLKAIFDDAGAADGWLPTEQILQRLNAMEESPWSEWSRGKPLTAQGLRSLLEPFKVYSSHNVQRTKRGYARAAFLDVWTRYLAKPAEEGVAIRPSVRNPAAARVSGDNASVRDGSAPDGCEKAGNPAPARVLDGRTDAPPLRGGDGAAGVKEWRL